MSYVSSGRNSTICFIFQVVISQRSLFDNAGHIFFHLPQVFDKWKKVVKYGLKVPNVLYRLSQCHTLQNNMGGGGGLLTFLLNRDMVRIRSLEY